MVAVEGGGWGGEGVRMGIVWNELKVSLRVLLFLCNFAHRMQPYGNNVMN